MSLGRFILSVPSGAAQLASDTFTRANETPLASPWLAVGTTIRTFNLSGNAVVAASLSLDTVYYYSSVTWPDAQYSEAKITVTSTSAGSGYGVLVRADVNGGANTYYRLVASHAASNNVELKKSVAGTVTSLGTISVTWTDGDVLRLEANGSTLKAKQNGTQIGSDFTDSAIASGNAGIALSSTVTGGNIDDWAGGSL